MEPQMNADERRLSTEHCELRTDCQPTTPLPVWVYARPPTQSSIPRPLNPEPRRNWHDGHKCINNQSKGNAQPRTGDCLSDHEDVQKEQTLLETRRLPN